MTSITEFYFHMDGGALCVTVDAVENGIDNLISNMGTKHFTFSVVLIQLEEA